MLKTAMAVLCLTTLAGSVGQAQEGAKQLPGGSIRATGEAVVSARPDRARVHFGVATQAASAQAAAQVNASQLENVLAQLRAALGPKADIQTVDYSLAPNYRYPREGGQPTIIGYTASNTVQITTDDLANLGSVIDAATQAGANKVQSLQFLVRDEAPLRARALGQAAREARANAEAMAGALGLRPSHIISVEEGEPQIVRPMLRAAAEMAATPIEPGGVEVRARVTVTMAVR